MHFSDFSWEDPLRGFDWVPKAEDVSSRQYGDRQVEMTHRELTILCGLLRHVQPQKVLEVGVAAGGTTAVMLKALSLLGSEAVLHSVDLNADYYANPALETGYMAKSLPEEARQAWRLHTGGTAGAFLDSIGPGIDLVVLDTAHVLPGELLDFLAVLPYLADGAMVVLHDTMLHHFMSRACIATNVLLCSATGDKHCFLDPNNPEKLANIAAFSINGDTKKYIENVFLALTLPWTYMPDAGAMGQYAAVIGKNYDPELVYLFKKAVNIHAGKLGGEYRL